MRLGGSSKRGREASRPIGLQRDRLFNDIAVLNSIIKHRKDKAELFMHVIGDQALRVYKLRGPYWIQTQKLHGVTEKLLINQG